MPPVRGVARPTSGASDIREQSRRAVRRSGHGGDGRRSGASFGAHPTGCGAQFRLLFGRGRRPPVLAPVACPATSQRGRLSEGATRVFGTVRQL
jgi:hypothetical protein